MSDEYHGSKSAKTHLLNKFAGEVPIHTVVQLRTKADLEEHGQRIKQTRGDQHAKDILIV